MVFIYLNIQTEAKAIRLSRYFPFAGTVKKYNLEKFQKDIIAGLTVAIIALPQSMAYVMIAGVHPFHSFILKKSFASASSSGLYERG